MSKIGRNEPCSCGSEKKYKNCCLQKKNDRHYSNQGNDIALNKRFNRYELTNTHLYINELGYEHRQTEDYFKKQYSGYIKCKLVHQQFCSVIVPDQIYIGSNPLLWIQPLDRQNILRLLPGNGSHRCESITRGIKGMGTTTNGYGCTTGNSCLQLQDRRG